MPSAQYDIHRIYVHRAFQTAVEHTYSSVDLARLHIAVSSGASFQIGIAHPNLIATSQTFLVPQNTLVVFDKDFSDSVRVIPNGAEVYVAEISTFDANVININSLFPDGNVPLSSSQFQGYFGEVTDIPAGSYLKGDWAIIGDGDGAADFAAYDFETSSWALTDIDSLGVDLTNLALGTIDNLTVEITNSSGTNVTLPAATATTAGLLTSAQFNKLTSVATLTDPQVQNILDNTPGLIAGGEQLLLAVSTWLSQILDKATQAETLAGLIDTKYLTPLSLKPVTDAITTRLGLLETKDATPTAGSTNIVESQGVKAALDAKLSIAALVDNTASTSIVTAATANQVKLLKDLIDNLQLVVDGIGESKKALLLSELTIPPFTTYPDGTTVRVEDFDGLGNWAIYRKFGGTYEQQLTQLDLGGSFAALTDIEVANPLIVVPGAVTPKQLHDNFGRTDNLFVTETQLSPVVPGAPTDAELTAYALGQSLKDIFLLYSGTDISTDPLTRVWYVDKTNNVVDLYGNTPPVLTNAEVLNPAELKSGTVSPAQLHSTFSAAPNISFNATRTTDILTNGDFTVSAYNSVQTNQGNNFNPVTGEFTAPFDCILQCNGIINWINGQGGNDSVFHAIYHNGVNVNRSQINPRHSTRVNRGATFPVGGTFNLLTGDTIALRIESVAASNNAFITNVFFFGAVQARIIS